MRFAQPDRGWLVKDVNIGEFSLFAYDLVTGVQNNANLGILRLFGRYFAKGSQRRLLKYPGESWRSNCEIL